MMKIKTKSINEEQTIEKPLKIIEQSRKDL